MTGSAGKLETERRIIVREAKSIVEAAMRVNGVSGIAGAAAKQYPDNIRLVSMDSQRHSGKERMQNNSRNPQRRPQ